MVPELYLLTCYTNLFYILHQQQILPVAYVVGYVIETLLKVKITAEGLSFKLSAHAYSLLIPLY